MSHAADSLPPHALFERRVRRDGVSGDGRPASRSMCLRLVFLPVRRVSVSEVRGRGGGRLKSPLLFLSLLHVKVQESPPVCMLFHFGPFTFNLFYGPDFCYISFDLVRLGPSIEINWKSNFHFDPPFNFWIGFK